MIVCVCQRVSCRDVEHAISAGARTLDDVTMATGACTQCRSCAQCIQTRLAQGQGALGLASEAGAA